MNTVTQTATVTASDVINAIRTGAFSVDELNKIKAAAAFEAQDIQVTADAGFPEFNQDAADFFSSTRTGIPMF